MYFIEQEKYDAQTGAQLKVLKEISMIYEEQAIEFWLSGGWAIDFILGKITRQHSDIDLQTWITDRERLENILLKLGYEQISIKKEFHNRQSDFRKGNVDITFGYLTYHEDGSLMLNGLPEWLWRADSLLAEQYQLHEIAFKVLHPKQLLAEKITYKEIGRPYRKKDEDSKKILYRIISEFD